MPLILTTPTNPGHASWEEGGTVAPAQVILGTVPVALIAPNNVLSDVPPHNLLDGNPVTSITCTAAGTYILEVQTIIRSTVTA